MLRENSYHFSPPIILSERNSAGDLPYPSVSAEIIIFLSRFDDENISRNITYRDQLSQSLHQTTWSGSRNAGDPIETPKFTRGSQRTTVATGTLRDAVKGWQKERQRPAGTVHEYERAVEMFIELHGDLSVAEIKKSHARKFREAVQQVPQRRIGAFRGAKGPSINN